MPAAITTAAATRRVPKRSFRKTIPISGCVGTKTELAACRATAHLAGARRLVAGVWHAITQHPASCAVAEALDSGLTRPGCVAGAACLLFPLPGGVWLG